MSEKKKCVIGYKTGVTDFGHVYGVLFSKLDECCKEFERWFNETGNAKVTDFSHMGAAPYNERNGVNFVTRGGDLQIELRVTNPLKIGTMRFCPWCGAEIEIKEILVVTLKQKQKQVADGYEEIDPWEK